jgi:hypothetical protein
LLRKSAEHYKAFGVSLMARLKAVSGSVWKCKNSVKSHTILLRPDGVHLNTNKDYGLSKVGVLYQEQGTLHFIVRCPLLLDEPSVAVVLQYLHNTAAEVAAVVVVLQYLHNTAAEVATVFVLCD